MVPAIGRIRNYEKVKFTVTMNKSIDIFWLPNEAKCPSVKFNKFLASLASANEEINENKSISIVMFNHLSWLPYQIRKC